MDQRTLSAYNLDAHAFAEDWASQPPALIAPSVQKLLAILQPEGTVYLSWRVTEGADKRDEYGRLYAAFDPNIVSQALEPSEILLDEQGTSASSGQTVRRIVARKRLVQSG